MAVGSKGIKGDVAHYADFGNRLRDGADRLADDIVGIGRFLALGILQLRLNGGKHRDHGDTQFRRLLRRPDDAVDA